MVCVNCLTFNHSNWILDAMNGFCQQETTFPFICTIVDDNSNDGAQIVINSFLESNFDLTDNSIAKNAETSDYRLVFAQHKTNKNCFFVVYFLKYNHYQIKKTKRPYFLIWSEQSKYVAICEGDDYWISPNKLQKQVEVLEKNQNYSMVCNRTKLLSVKQNRFIGENYCYDKSRTVNPKDVINRTGLFISTCSIICRAEIRENEPSYVAQCKVGDYPLQIMCAMRGEIYYINDTMSVYRVENSNSWMGRQKWTKLSEDRLEIIHSQVRMFCGFAKDYPQYKRVFENKTAQLINRCIPNRKESPKDIRAYLSYFDDYVKSYSLRNKIDKFFNLCRIPGVRYIYTQLFMRGYEQRKKLYK